jgi:hypothetical protein
MHSANSPRRRSKCTNGYHHAFASQRRTGPIG